MGYTCDACGGDEFTGANPLIRYCRQRPSDHSDMCCVMWGHWLCLGGEGPYVARLPTIANGERDALATLADLETWIESPEARRLEYVFIT